MEFAFYFASGIAVVSTLRVVTNTNPVHALLYLIISLIAVAMTFFALGAPFAGVLEVIAYAGAIMVLFVFVVMMLNLGPASVEQERTWLTPDFELGEFKRQDLVYEKEDLLISGPGKYPEYNFYRMAGMAVDGKAKGEAENEAKPINVKGLMP